jgi:membrane-associated phospholipid phosphatase
MSLKKLLQQLRSIDQLLIVYVLLTSVYIIVFFDKVPFPLFHLVPRIFLLAGIIALPLLNQYIKKPVYEFLRIGYPLILLSFFYSETDALNNVFFDALDIHFARLDSMIFGFQPSLEFYNSFPQSWFSELMNFGYFSYYFLITIFAIVVFVKDRINFEKQVFLITCSFFVYYLIFAVIPVSGPQYFFDSPHNTIADSGIFRSLVKLVEFIGERPTAAFPSSHVGMVLILLCLAWEKHRTTFYIFLPLFILLSLSTVYIKAHYAVDVMGGLISAPLILMLSNYIWSIFNKKTI